LFEYVVTRELPRLEKPEAAEVQDVQAFKDILQAAADGKFDEDDVDDEVFIQTWIPSNLNQVSDQRYLERELEKRQRGEEVLYERLLADKKADEEGQSESQESSESEAEGDKLEDDQVDNESDSEEGNKCDGHKPDGVDKAEWKKKVKEEKREKRKEKVPKALKKRFRKQAAQGR